MTDTATPETGPVDAPASLESVTAEFEAGNTEAPDSAIEGVVQELVNEAEGTGDAEAQAEAPATEDDATDPADEAAEPEEGTPEEPTYSVKVNGEELAVPLSELLKGYSRTEDYKAKTTAVAKQRRDLEARATTIEADVKAHYANQLEEMATLVSKFDPVLAQANQIDWETLKRTDPATYVQAQDAVNERLTAIQQMKQEAERNRTEAQQQQTQQAERERETRLETAAAEIAKALPDLADEAKFATFATDAIGLLREAGFNQEEIADSLDHRVLMLANDARQWRAHKAAQQSLPAKKVVSRSAVKPLTTDGGSSRASTPRFPANASRDRKTDWVVSQLLSEE